MELNCGRRATRRLVATRSLASGVFLVVSVASFRNHSDDEWRERDSGSGGFAFWVETPSPVEIAGTLDGTVFQGSFVVDEERFLEHDPSPEEPRVLLVEGGSDLAAGRRACRNRWPIWEAR